MAMQRLRAAVRAGIVDRNHGTLTVQARLLAERCAQLTPPRNKGQGQTAVARDLTRLFYPVSHTTFTDKRLREIVRKDNRTAWDKVSPRFSASPLKSTRAIAFSPELHAKNRNARGRVSGRRNFGTVTLGPQGIKARGYMKDRQKNVGWARAGWSAGIVGLGGVVKTSWVSRHGTGRGALTDGRGYSDPYVVVANNTGWARYRGREGERIIANAMASRFRDMQRYVERAMLRARDQALRGASALPTAA